MKYALVTGSTSGIGKAVADRLVQEGYEVIRNGHSDNMDYENYIKADLSDESGIEELAETVRKMGKKLSVVVLNVGTTCRKEFGDITHTEFAQVMDMNVVLPFLLLQKLDDILEEGGAILFTGSMMGVLPHATSIPYGVSKAAVCMMAQYLVKEYASRSIRVNAVCPGFVDTNWQKNKPDRLREKIESKIALNRFGKVEEIADFCVSIIVNTYVNGSVLNIDGGYNKLH